VLLLALTKYQHERSGAQLDSYLGLDIINNVCEARDSLHRMADDFCIGNANWCECLVRSLKILISVMTLGSDVTTLLLLHFKLMSGF
jgi:hypothetical protein